MADYFRIETSIVNGKLQKTGTIIDGLIQILGSQILTDAKFNPHEEKLADDELIEILRLRPVESRRSQSLTFVYEESDFLPFEFLGRGIWCGRAVCQLKYQAVSDADVDKVVQSIEQINFDGLDMRDIFAIEISGWTQDMPASQALRVPAVREQLKHSIKKQPIPVATGFLVGKNYLLTNSHVLFGNKEIDENELSKFSAEFSYEKTTLGQSFTYRFKRLIHASQSLDYALLELTVLTKDEINSQNQDKLHKITYLEAGNNFGWLILRSDADILPFIRYRRFKNLLAQVDVSKQKEELNLIDFPGEPIFIIQHPKGRSKEIVLFNNKIQELYIKYLQYEADAELGSSGSPIFNSRWELVGIHQSALVCRNLWYDFVLNAILDVLKWLLRQPRFKLLEFSVKGQLGIRASKIFADLERESKNSNHLYRGEIQAFVKAITEPRPSHVFILVGRNRKSLLGEDDSKREASLTEILQQDIAKALQGSPDLKVIPVPIPSDPNPIGEKRCREEADRNRGKCHDLTDEIKRQSCLTNVSLKEQECFDLTRAIAWINDPFRVEGAKYEKFDSTFDPDLYEYEIGDVALEVVMDHSPEQPEARGAKAYYFYASEERRIHAEILLHSLTKEIQMEPKLPYRGARGDNTVSEQGLRFCRGVWMPSIILYVGFLSNPEDVKLVKEQSPVIAQAIVNGIRAWVNTIRPNFDPKRYVRNRR